MADWPPLKNSTFTVTSPVYDNDGDLVTGAAALDSEVSIDGGTFADCTNEASEIATSSGIYTLALTAAEMNGDIIATITKTTTSNAKTAVNVMYTVTRQLLNLAFPTMSGRSIDVEATGEVGINLDNVTGTLDAAEIGTGAITAAKFAAGAIDATAIAAGAIDADAIAADAIGASEIADGAIDAGAIAADAITAAKIAANAIGASEIADGAIDAATFAAGAINAAAIADGAIDRATFAVDTGLQTIRSNTAQAGAAGTVTLDASASAVTDFYVGALIFLTGATGVGQVRVCTAYNGTSKVATIAPNWATNPDATSTFAILSFGQMTGVQGNVTGSVGSVTGAVGSVTGNVGGNVTGSVGSVASGGITTASFAAGAINAAAVATDAIGAAELAADAANEIADAILKRDIDQVEATMALHSLGTAILKAVSRIVDDAGTLKLYRTDGSTLHLSQTITVDAAADPIDELTVGV